MFTVTFSSKDLRFMALGPSDTWPRPGEVRETCQRFAITRRSLVYRSTIRVTYRFR